MAPRVAQPGWRSAVMRTDPRLLALGLGFFALGVLLALTIENAPVRYAGSVTAVAIGLGLLRRAFRVE